VPSNSNPQVVAAEFRPGDLIGERYHVRNVAGTGPDSTVYRAEDTVTRQPIALKIIKPAAARDNSLVSKYRLDLKLFRQANHAALVRILDTGEHLGRMYVALELLDGTTLREYLRSSGPIPPDSCAVFLSQVCDALGALHAQHVVHRNIHPGNVMQTAAGAWKLLEFGIGGGNRRRGDAAESAYTAPEVLLGREATFASDVFAVAAVCYEMLTGRRPAKGAAAVQIDREVAGAPEGLGAILERCLQIDPAKRFPSAQALKAAVRDVFARQSAAGRRRLADLRSESGTPAQELLTLFQSVVRSLIENHATGREHAELSPDNIRVNGPSVEFEARSKASSGSSGQPTLLISDAKYTAPELILAQRAPDPAAHACGDVYVLGFVFYELLAGTAELQRQFGDQVRTGLAWMRWHADPASKLRPLAEAAPACPKGVAELIDRMVEKDPSKRVGTLEEVAGALDKLGFILARTQPFAIGRPATRKRRRKQGLALAALCAAAVLAVIAGAARYGPWLRQQFTQATGGIRQPAMKASAAGVSLPSAVQTATGAMVLVPQSGVATVAPFYIDRLEVTNRDYREYCARAGRRMPDAPSWDPDYHGKDDLPAVNVDRDAAASYCDAGGKRLPTEREWEQAAGAAERPVVRWGNWTLPGLANLRLHGAERPSAVGTFGADVSPFGVLDAAGNVHEWVADGAEPGTGVVKGGSFATAADQLSPTWRRTMFLNARADDLSSVGFRCAVDLQAALALRDRAQVASAKGPLGWLRRLTDGIR
jgi:serine/threonine protein kinase